MRRLLLRPNGASCPIWYTVKLTLTFRLDGWRPLWWYLADDDDDVFVATDDVSWDGILLTTSVKSRMTNNPTSQPVIQEILVNVNERRWQKEGRPGCFCCCCCCCCCCRRCCGTLFDKEIDCDDEKTVDVVTSLWPSSSSSSLSSSSPSTLFFMVQQQTFPSWFNQS